MRITEAQYETLQAIEDLISECGYPPTIRAIMFHCGLKSPAPVQSRINGLIEAGALTSDDGKARTLKVLVPSAAFIQVDRAKGDRVQRYQRSEAIAL